jgi:hypothetical protein
MRSGAPLAFGAIPQNVVVTAAALEPLAQCKPGPIVKLEALRAAHLDRQVQARWELKRLPKRIADLRARVETIAADVAFRDAHAPQPNVHGDKPFSFVVDGRVYSDRVEAAPALAAVIDRGVDESFAAGQATGSCPSVPIAPIAVSRLRCDRRPAAQSVWACAALSEAMPWSTQLPARSMRRRCLHTASGSSNGSTTSLTHSMPSSRRHRMASPAKKPT